MNEVIIPPYLKKGDKVLLISPSSKIDKKLVRAMRARLTSWGLKPIIGKHALAKSGSFAGTIKQRTTDLQYGLDHKSIRAIFCTRGGYGMIQVLEQISLKRFLENPKWIIGYSDISGIHSLLSKHNIASIHGPMARHFALAPKEDLAIEFLKNTLRGESMKYIIKGHKYNHKGAIEAHIYGGNLTTIANLRGTTFARDLSDSILYIEDVNESPSQVERMLYGYKLDGTLDKIAGLIIGQFNFDHKTEKDTFKVYQRIHRLIKNLKIPVAFNFPIGHGDLNYPIINGSMANFQVSKNVVELNFR